MKIPIIVNALAQIQAKEKFDEEKAESNRKDGILNKLYEPTQNLETNSQKSYPKDISPF